MEAVAQRNARLPNATITNDINAKIGENIMSIKSLKGTNIETITLQLWNLEDCFLHKEKQSALVKGCH